MKIQVREVEIPEGSLISKSFQVIDYADAFETEFITEKNIQLKDLVQAKFLSIPPWVGLLLKIRNILVKLIGLKTKFYNDYKNEIESFTGDIGDSIFVFRVYDKYQNEIMMGSDDKHLDFRCSFFLNKKNDKYNINISTTVHFNRISGKIYFFSVKPFHRIIIPILIKRMIKNINEPS